MKNIKRSQQKSITIKEIHHINSCDLSTLQHQWLKTKKHRYAHSFLNDPNGYKYSPETRCFVAMYQHTIVSLRFFTPISQNNCIYGYTAHSAYYTKNTPKNTQTLLLYEAIKIFQKEGLRLLNLGLSPLDQACIDHEKNLLKKLLKCLTRKCLTPFINLDGIELFKRQFKAYQEPYYIAFRSPLAFLSNIHSLYWTLWPKRTTSVQKK